MKAWLLTVILLSAVLFAFTQWSLRRDREQFARELATHSPAIAEATDNPPSLAPPQQSIPLAPQPVSTPSSTSTVRTNAPAQLPPSPRPSRQPAPTQPPDPASLGRTALAFVGSDSAANDAWYQVINDLSLDPHTRKDLIEDLNQDGFDDPRNLSPADLPLIESRIALIEQVAPFAPDDTNYAAFQEAYKDLLNMRTKAAQNAP